jgi:hypothetical protein
MGEQVVAGKNGMSKAPVANANKHQGKLRRFRSVSTENATTRRRRVWLN